MAMHACQIGPNDVASPCPGSPQQTCVETKGGTLWGRQPFCPHFFSATQVCGRCDYTLRSFWDLRISGLGGKLAARCLRSRPAWILFCFRCWVADGKNRADGKVRHWVLGGRSYGLPLPLPRYLHLAAHCQSDKSGHLVPSFCAFQHNRDHMDKDMPKVVTRTKKKSGG